MSEQVVLSMKGISKEYYGNKVLKDVDLVVKAGEIHALVGENGAGKSTLMNVLFGMPVIHSTGGYEGDVEISGEKVEIMNPHDAMNYGIGMVHQEFMLIPDFTITENIKVGREIGTPTIFSKILGPALDVLDRKKMRDDARKALSRIGLNIEEYVKVAGLPIGYKQFVEIAREIDKTGIKLLVFDEPTAVLTESEAERLCEIMQLIAGQGIAIIFITHRLDEVMSVADSLTILRDGELVDRINTDEVTVVDIAGRMIGRKMERLVDVKESREVLSDEVALELENFHVDMPGEQVKGMNVSIRKGEIFGFGGLAGQGKLGIINGMMSLFPVEGEVNVFGKKLNFGKLGDALENDIAFVSEDRRGVGLLLGESIEDNIVFSAMQVRNKFTRGPFRLVHKKQVREHALEMIEIFDIRSTGPRQKTGSLSGGNQQKVCLARALTLEPKILIVAEPTRGIDIGAKKLVLEYLIKINAEQGMTIIIISSELVELRSICDRIAIVSEGKVAEILLPDASDVAFGLAMSGLSAEEVEEEAVL
ncbi:MAG: sugar ABC transporter ATP-binding protein [Eubacteriales bacterium]|nr:sugar ABC transporter ATP-binding protein [Eubacteriales bacterium]MDD4324205.1 sugar ABC transporter ATP-binding protein [Eubacteriales bacterium]MDD4541139.1 sugar ABC transporter ATP-binding protein [Eubacteriales bacterium]